MFLRAGGRRSEAVDLLWRACAISRKTGITFVGPWIRGHLAVTTGDPATRREALAEGEEILRKGSVGHSHLWFHRYAIEASLGAGEWDCVERHAEALESRSEEHTSELQSLMRISYAVFCLKQKK